MMPGTRTRRRERVRKKGKKKERKRERERWRKGKRRKGGGRKRWRRERERKGKRKEGERKGEEEREGERWRKGKEERDRERERKRRGGKKEDREMKGGKEREKGKKKKRERERWKGEWIANPLSEPACGGRQLGLPDKQWMWAREAPRARNLLVTPKANQVDKFGSNFSESNFPCFWIVFGITPLLALGVMQAIFLYQLLPGSAKFLWEALRTTHKFQL